MSLRSSGLPASYLRSTHGNGIEPALGMDEQFAALDDAHFLGAAECGAFQHGEDGGGGVRQRIRRVRSQDARGCE